MKRDFFLFIPAYNVERELPALLASIPPEVLLRSAEVLIIDDGSSDGTLAVAEDFARSEIRTNVRVESLSRNSGYGEVVKRGISRSRELSRALNVRFAVCLHGDGQYPAKSILPMVLALQNSDAAICQGSRLLKRGGAKSGNMPLYKFVGGKLLTLVENCVFENRQTDRHSGLLAYRTSFLRKLDLGRLGDSFDIDLEILATADARGERILEIPIETRYAGEKSHLRVVPYGLRVLKVAFRRWKGFYG